MSLEMSGPDASRPFIETASPEHPSLLDPTHRLGELFGVVNIPNVVWIDEDGMIVRPAEPGWPAARMALPSDMLDEMPELGRAPTAPPAPDDGPGMWDVLGSGQNRENYADAIRDWAVKGSDSQFAMDPATVVARSGDRSADQSAGAAHFALANELWRRGRRERAIAHFNEAHRLQPENWTYKRQAWSALGHERVGGTYGRFAQGPVAGEEADWPFASDFQSDVLTTDLGGYYPQTL